MSRGAQLRVSSTRTIPKPNYYIQALYNEFGPYCFDEAAAPLNRGRWRQTFNASAAVPLDLEIGPGNGLHFAQRAYDQPERLLVGIELKYKPLIQSVRRARRLGLENARMMRYNASLIHQVFADEELDQVFIHFPDPWSKTSQQKHRLLQKEFILRLWQAQKKGALLEVKMDNHDYFRWFLSNIADTPYRQLECTFDLHGNGTATGVITQFERLFIQQGQPICRALLQK